MCLPYAVEDFSVGVYAQQDIWHDDVVEVPLLLVREEQVRLPDLVRVREREVADPAVLVVELQNNFIQLYSELKLRNYTFEVF